MSRKAHGLWEQLWQWPNLELALHKTLRGKRERADAKAFLAALPGSLSDVGERLRTLRGPQGIYHDFTIHDPKERLISAPCFADRVLHHAVFNVCEPVFERRLIFDTYACRTGKGVHAAVERACHFVRKHPWYLKLDVRHYFETIPREVLLHELSRLFGEPEMLAIFATLVRSWRPGSAIGLPIGALFSQHLGNFLLGRVDRFIKEQLRAPGYVRYMDDLAIWSADRSTLCDWSKQIVAFFRLHLHQELKTPIVQRSAQGMDFLGRRVRPGWAGLNCRSRKRWRKHVLSLELADEPEQVLQQRATALFASVRLSSCLSFRRRVLCAGHESQGRSV